MRHNTYSLSASVFWTGNNRRCLYSGRSILLILLNKWAVFLRIFTPIIDIVYILHFLDTGGRAYITCFHHIWIIVLRRVTLMTLGIRLDNLRCLLIIIFKLHDLHCVIISRFRDHGKLMDLDSFQFHVFILIGSVYPPCNWFF